MNLTLETIIELTIAVVAFALIINVVFDLLYAEKNCEGVAPILNSNTMMGPNQYKGTWKNQSWTYDPNMLETDSCTWKCVEGALKKNNTCELIIK